MAMKENKTVYIRAAMFMITFSTGITWTGLGFELSKIFEFPRFLSIMQLGSIFASLISPYFVFKYLRKFTFLREISQFGFNSGICFFLMVFIWHFCAGRFGYFPVVLVVGLSFCSMLMSAMEATILEPAYAKSIEGKKQTTSLSEEFARLASGRILGKIFGMTLGPLLFRGNMSAMLLLTSCFYFVSSYLIRIGFVDLPAENLNVDQSKNCFNSLFFQEMKKQVKKSAFWESAIANSGIFLVVISLSTYLLYLDASSSIVSTYFFGATVCSFCSHYILGNFSEIRKKTTQMDRKVGFLYAILAVFPFFTKNVWVVCAFQWLFSLTNPIVTNRARSKFYQHYEKSKDIGLIYSLRDLVSNIFVFFVSLVIAISPLDFSFGLLCCFVPLVLFIRWRLGANAHKYAAAPS